MHSKLDLFLFTELDCEFNFFLTLSMISLDDETYYQFFSRFFVSYPITNYMQ